MLINTSGYLAGRVIGSDGKPIAGANVFNRGDAPEPVATSTDSQGRFRLEGLFPGRKYAFIRKEGYRFTGIKADDDADGLTITLHKTSEPPPAWKPGSASSYDDQRAFAKQVLIRLWEKYGADPEKTGASQCIEDMAGIDPNLALEWSAQHGRRYDDVVRRVQARKLAETDAPGALALLKQEARFGQPAHLAVAGRAVRGDRPQEGHTLRRGSGGAGARADPVRTARGDGPGRGGPGQAGPCRCRPQADRRGGPGRRQARHQGPRGLLPLARRRGAGPVRSETGTGAHRADRGQ